MVASILVLSGASVAVVLAVTDNSSRFTNRRALVKYVPGRVVMQDFTDVPCIVDLATMREAVAEHAEPSAATAPVASTAATHDRLDDCESDCESDAAVGSTGSIGTP